MAHPLIHTLALQFGRAGGQTPLLIHPGPISVFVGPNNSGKSLVLREINQILSNQPFSHSRIIQGMRIHCPELSALKALLVSRAVPIEHNSPGTITVVASKVGLEKSSSQFYLPDLETWYATLPDSEDTIEISPLNPQDASQRLASILYFSTLLLDGKTRLSLTSPIAPGDLSATPRNHLAALVQNDGARARMREITHDAFGRYFVIDPLAMAKLRVRMADRAPLDAEEELSLSSRARAFHQSAVLIDEMSDGVKAFTGINAAVLSGDYRVFLLDEPEAFLHPPLAYRLGQLVTTLSAENEAQVFASTHSAHFLMGCIETGKPVDVIRLSYEGDVAHARLLPAAEVESLMRDPLLRSTDVMSALFHRGAIICESDRDRAFYGEVNRRILQVGPDGAHDTVLLNAQNAQTIKRLIGPLRNMGIPAAALVDLDIIHDGNAFKELLKAASVPQSLVHSWGTLRGNIDAAFGKSSAAYKAGGVQNIPADERDAAQSLISNLADYGVFLVPVGEVEDWLGSLGVPRTPKDRWLVEIFERMGEDPTAPEYVHPDTGDVWNYIRMVARWIGNPHRKGMPA
jgi:ABC-type cobalamin/Fe3+-siderophores transport system ATPase subunit